MVYRAATFTAIAGILYYVSTSSVSCQHDCPTVKLNSSGHFLCPGQNVNFTCEVRQSNTEIITWFVNKSRIQLHVRNLNMPRNLPGNHNIMAVLSQRLRLTSTNPHLYVLKSELRITDYNYASTNISCSTGDECIRDSITLHLLENPSRPHNAKYYNVMYNGLEMPNQPECILYLFWNSPSNTATEDLTGYTFHDNGKFLFNKTNEDSAAMISYECGCDLSNRITIRAVSRCNYMSHSTSFKQLEGIFNCHSHCCVSSSDQSTTNPPSDRPTTITSPPETTNSPSDTTTYSSSDQPTTNNYSPSNSSSDNTDSPPTDRSTDCYCEDNQASVDNSTMIAIMITIFLVLIAISISASIIITYFVTRYFVKKQLQLKNQAVQDKTTNKELRTISELEYGKSSKKHLKPYTLCTLSSW